MSRPEQKELQPPGLGSWGWNALCEDQWLHLGHAERQRLEPGRVVKELRGVLEVQTSTERIDTRIPGRWFRTRRDGSQPAIPTVGDWVLVPRERSAGDCWIAAVLPRQSKFSRQAAGLETREQVVTANVDLLIVVMGLDGDYNIRRLERFLSAARESGAEPIVVLNKADKVAQPLAVASPVIEAAAGAEVYVTAADAESPELPAEAAWPEGFHGGIDDLRMRLTPGLTVAFVGSSGVGKSSLVNRLFGQRIMEVRAVRSRDDRGQHTTSHRELLRLQNGSLLVDNPGVRELLGWNLEDGLDETFEEIDAAAAQCRFRNCLHIDEPGCAVLAAVDAGAIEPRRLEHFQQLAAEAAAQAHKAAERKRQDESRAARRTRHRRRNRRGGR